MGKLSVLGMFVSGVLEKLKMMEVFLVCGLELSVEVCVVVDSVSAAREARLSGVVDDVVIIDLCKLCVYWGIVGEMYKVLVLFYYFGGEVLLNFVVDEVVVFCFSYGVESRLFERTSSMSKL